MRILIVSQFVDFPTENGNDRFCYLADMLHNMGADVCLMTSDFVHTTKKHRQLHSIPNLKKMKYEVLLCHEPGYNKNVSVKRIISHEVFAEDVKKRLEKMDDTPDLIYCAIPSLGVGRIVREFAKKKGIKYIIDVQDLWPEAFKMVFNVPVISDMLFKPMEKMADVIYRDADEIVAVSESYKDRAISVNRNNAEGLTVFLGTDAAIFDQYRRIKKLSESDDIIRLVYIGTLGYSYDLTIIFDALRILKKNNINNIEFRVIGDGPLQDKFKEYSKRYDLNVVYYGRIEYACMVEEMTKCDIAVNPITHGAAQSITNKVGDYFIGGLPVINTQENYELRKLIKDNQCGINCKNGDGRSVAKAIFRLIKDSNLRTEMGHNSRKVGLNQFDRRKTYQKIADIIIEKAEDKKR